ncbi:MAG: DUF2238 domain-containing protein [Gammaproteobacteria bacterium]
MGTRACSIDYRGHERFLRSPRIKMVSPELGAAYLGTQGDEWDAQKDTTMAIIGAHLPRVRVSPL